MAHRRKFEKNCFFEIFSDFDFSKCIRHCNLSWPRGQTTKPCFTNLNYVLMKRMLKQSFLCKPWEIWENRVTTTTKLYVLFQVLFCIRKSFLHVRNILHIRNSLYTCNWGNQSSNLLSLGWKENNFLRKMDWISDIEYWIFVAHNERIWDLMSE